MQAGGEALEVRKAHCALMHLLVMLTEAAMLLNLGIFMLTEIVVQHRQGSWASRFMPLLHCRATEL